MGYAIGIDLGGTFIKYAIIEQHRGIVFDGKLPSNATVSAEGITTQLISAVKICIAYASTNSWTLLGVGVGTPGIVDASRRTVLGGAENLKGWENIPLAQIIELETSLPTLVDNDGNLMGLGETSLGAAQGCSDVIFITIGTGIGGAVIIDGKLFGGYRNCGTELGHIVLFADGEKCACGAVGCLEHYASTSALVRRYKERCRITQQVLPNDCSGETIVKLFLAHDPLAVESIQEHCRFLGQGIASLINIFSPERVVIGGGISEAGEFYIDMIRQHALRYALSTCISNTTVMGAKLGNRAGSIGAAAMVFTNTKAV